MMRQKQLQFTKVGIKAWLGSQIQAVARVPFPLFIVSAAGVCLSNLCPTRPAVTASSPARYNPAQIIPSGTEKLLRPFGQQFSSPAKKKFLSQPNRCPTLHNWPRRLRQELAGPMAFTREPIQPGHKICFPSGVFLVRGANCQKVDLASRQNRGDRRAPAIKGHADLPSFAYSPILSCSPRKSEKQGSPAKGWMPTSSRAATPW